MAGSYPDAPSRRMAWDADGSVSFYWAVNGSDFSTEHGASDKVNMNGEDDSTAPSGVGSGSPDHWTAVLFPELREIDGAFAARVGGSSIQGLDHSPDTTNGRDGTWTTEVADLTDYTSVPGNYRSGIVSMAASSKRGLRIRQNLAGTGSGAGWRAIHIYGEIAAGQTPDRLLIIDETTGLEYTAPRDYGDVPRGSSEDREWRIRNNSASLTANTIQYTAEALVRDANTWYTHTLPGGSTYQSTRQIASLAPATTTGVIVTRRVTPGTAIDLYAARVYLNVDTWS